MGTARTSNKDILEALDNGFDRLITALTANAVTAPVAASDNIPVLVPEDDTPTVEVDPEYLSHMNGKAQAHATDKGIETVLYARVNKANQTKLAYALRERYDTVVAKQPSCKGAVATFQPA